MKEGRRFLRQRSTKACERNFPGGPVIKKPPFNGGGLGSIPGQGTRIPCAEEQLSP